ncbi:MAG: tetratricopeptide repeat protein [Nitrospirae bacterium]|nr:tetratricopeptide repeat protein [Nitrospirota bacterium]
MFIFIAAVILIVVMVLLAFPLWMTSSIPIPLGHEASLNQERIDLEIEKQTLLNSLAELDLDLAQGRLTPSDYQRLKAVDENRLVRILDKQDALAESGPSPPAPKSTADRAPFTPMTWAGSAALSLLVVGTAAGIYGYIHGKIGLEAQRVAMEQGSVPRSSQGMPNPIEMVARLEKRLKKNPDDLEGQIMAGRSYMTLKRMEDAQKAWQKVTELDYGNYEAHYFLGLILLQTTQPDDRKNTEEALSHLETALVKVPREPAVLWYKGVALVRLKQYPLADKTWTEAYQNLAPGTDDAEFVRNALQNLRAGNPPVL